MTDAALDVRNDSRTSLCYRNSRSYSPSAINRSSSIPAKWAAELFSLSTLRTIFLLFHQAAEAIIFVSSS